MKKIRKILIPSIITILLVAIVAWKLSSNKKVMEEKAAIAETKTVVFPVTVVHSKSQLLNQFIEVNGVFNPNHSLNFLSELSGRIVQLSIREGQMVSKGQQIAKIDDEQLLIDIELATATLDKAKSDLIKYEGMLAGNAATKQQIEDFKMQVKSAEARLATLKRQLRATKIVSPISGVVNKLSLEVGSFVSPGASIAEILDISSLKMKASLLDRDVVRFKVGQTITVKPDLYPTSPRNGKITYIASKADASRNYSVEIELANSAKEPLKAGMTGVVSFEMSEERQTNMLPIQCIVGGLQDPQVYVVVNNVAVKRSIQTGYIQGDYVEVLGGLTVQDQVVRTGQLNIADGSKVEIIK
jgi:RND family efflux transporter MFP subunit